MAERRCANCRSMASLSEMKYNKAGTDLICAACIPADRGVKQGYSATAHILDEIDKEEKKDTFTTTANVKVSEPQDSAQKEESGKIVSYQCGACGFGFSRSGNVVIDKCPYCGNDKVRSAFRDSAQEMIDEAKGTDS